MYPSPEIPEIFNAMPKEWFIYPLGFILFMNVALMIQLRLKRIPGSLNCQPSEEEKAQMLVNINKAMTLLKIFSIVIIIFAVFLWYNVGS